MIVVIKRKMKRCKTLTTHDTQWAQNATVLKLGHNLVTCHNFYSRNDIELTFE